MSLDAVPPPAGARHAVRQVEAWWRSQRLWGCREQVEALGWVVRIAPLGAADGGLQAILMPRLSGGFALVVDPDPTPWQAAAGTLRKGLVEWRTAHEYAHTFFYARRAVPRRAVAACAAEEQFCDAFANALLGTDLSSATGRVDA
jgi:hypothetical protein